MQTDARLVQNVQNARQCAADLRCQTDTLTFTARQRHRRSCKGEVIEPHVTQETKTAVDFFQNRVRNQVLRFRQGRFQLVHEIAKVIHGHIAKLRDIFTANGHRKGFLFQTLPLTAVAGRVTHQTLDIASYPVRGRSRITAL